MYVNQYVLAMNLRRWIGQNEKHRIQRFDPSGSLVAYRLVFIFVNSKLDFGSFLVELFPHLSTLLELGRVGNCNGMPMTSLQFKLLPPPRNT